MERLEHIEPKNKHSSQISSLNSSYRERLSLQTFRVAQGFPELLEAPQLPKRHALPRAPYAPPVLVLPWDLRRNRIKNRIEKRPQDVKKGEGGRMRKSMRRSMRMRMRQVPRDKEDVKGVEALRRGQLN
eukprot:25442-Hanusia_phi.AAC.1